MLLTAADWIFQLDPAPPLEASLVGQVGWRAVGRAWRDDPSAVPEAVRTYWSQHLGFRNSLLRGHAALTVLGLGVSTAGDELGLCLDVGHCLCTFDLPVSAVIERYAQRLFHVHLDDIKDGVHEHRQVGGVQ